MAENTQPAAIAIAAAPPRSTLREWIPAIISIVTTAVLLGGFLIAIGGWRATVDQRLDELDRRLVKTDAFVDKVVPELAGMKSDLRYLAERAKREDDRRERALARHGE